MKKFLKKVVVKNLSISIYFSALHLIFLGALVLKKKFENYPSPKTMSGGGLGGEKHVVRNDDLPREICATRSFSPK